MIRPTSLLFLGCLTLSASAQIIDIDYSRTGLSLTQTSTKAEDPVEVLKNGFVDFVSDGNIQASARLLRINIGERDKFYIPFYIYTGASGNAFGSENLNQTTVANLLNPVGGTINLSFNGLQDIIGESGITKLKFAYQVGGRLINGRDSVTKENLNFFNGLANLGFFFQTGAWTPDDPDNMGMFFLQAKFSASVSSEGDFQKVFGKTVLDNNLLMGYSIDAGIEINKVINLKVGVYQFTNNSAISLFNEPVVKLSIDYSMEK